MDQAMLNKVLRPYRRYAEFTGRSGRYEYWMFFLFYMAVSIICAILGDLISYTVGNALRGVFALGTIVPLIAVGIRRMHDINKSGWFILIPLFNLYLFAQPGMPGPNQYGAPDLGEAA